VTEPVSTGETSSGGAVRRRRPRTCVGCGEESPKRTMLRVVRTPDGVVRLDPTGKAPGRGAYVCAREECVLRARKRDALARSLKVPVERALYESLLEAARRESADGGNGASRERPGDPGPSLPGKGAAP
jgi:hypothetical protein